MNGQQRILTARLKWVTKDVLESTVGENEKERLTAAGYAQFMENELTALLEDVPLQTREKLWLQHDGAPVHFGQQVRDFLNKKYSRNWIGKGGFVDWPARSPDCSP